MQMHEYSVDAYPTEQLFRKDSTRTETSIYLQLTEQDFSFAGYDHGSKELRERYGIRKQLSKYFNKRKFLFSRFDQGIQLDEESLFSVIPEAVSLHLLTRLIKSGVNKCFEPFCGVGGIAVHFAGSIEEYTVNDIDPAKVRMLRQNLKVYHKSEGNLNFHEQDFLSMQPFLVDAVIICPPWGGINLADYAHAPLDCIMQPTLTAILSHALRFSRNLMLQLPKNTNIDNLVETLIECNCGPVAAIEKIMTNNKLSQLFFYVGEERFTGVPDCRLYAAIYKDIGHEHKQQRKETSRALKKCPRQVMRAIYQRHHPKLNTHIFFN